LNDFAGDNSTADNSLDQMAYVNQTFDVDLTASVQNRTEADELEAVYNQSRFRTIEANLEDQSAQAIFTSGQRQGSAEDAVSQVAVADGGHVNNEMGQLATIVQTGNEVDLEADIDLRRGGPSGGGPMFTEKGPLSPRTTDILVNINKLGGTNSAVNSSAACQEQAVVQSGAGGVDESGNVTENGGTAKNVGDSLASNDEETTVVNSISIEA